jgi:hypothetical protein
MDFGLILVSVILIGYMSLLLYLNSKVKLGNGKQYELPNKHKALQDTIAVTGLGFIGFILPALLIFAVGIIFFRGSFLPR